MTSPWSGSVLSTYEEQHMLASILKTFCVFHVQAGAHGVEARYPFLDPRVVQELRNAVSGARRRNVACC